MSQKRTINNASRTNEVPVDTPGVHPGFTAGELADWTGGTWSGGTPGHIRRIIHDTRSLAPGDVYLALRGERCDGHDFIPEALKRGAVGVIAERVDTDTAMPTLRVADSRRALFELAAGHRQRCRAKVVGVTGSVGKTTVKEMVADVLSCRGLTARTPGNWNNDIGLPLSTLAMSPEADFGVFELGINHPGEMEPLARMLSPDWGVMTAVGPVHIEFFDNEEHIAREKAKMIELLPSDGLAIMDRDSAWFSLIERLSPCPVISVSSDSRADYRAEIHGATAIFIEDQTGERAAYTPPLPGRHIMANALLAYAVGREAGVSPEAAIHALEAYRPPSMRWQSVDIHGITVINDAYNANPISMAAAITTFGDMPVAGSKWLVLGTMGELGDIREVEHRKTGAQAARGEWAGIIGIGEGGCWIIAGARDAGSPAQRARAYSTVHEAAAMLASGLKPGDAILIKASRSEKLERLLQLLDEQLSKTNVSQKKE